MTISPTDTPSATPDALSLTGLTRSFGAVRAVAGLDLSVRPGEVVAFLGPNGAGKTTTIDMILGLGRPDAGSVRVFGMTPRQAVDRGLVAAVLQTGGLLPDLSVLETVQLTASLFPAAIPATAALQRAGIAELSSRTVSRCSGGEQQRLRFAMALVSEPALLILDEPTTGLDVEGRRRFWSAIHADAERGRTVLFATHYLEEADEYADRIVLMARGRVVADGTVAQIRAAVGGRTVRATLGSPDLTPDLTPVRTALSGLDVSGLDVRGRTLTITTGDSDAVAHALLRDRLAHDLEITTRGLDDAFLALTGDPR
ncbi:MAG: ABC transporter ATP-binding protein [Actinobacteria bacterium]|nr:ABC transporter ATP-binding protein [Actinomycetota bacterium]